MARVRLSPADHASSSSALDWVMGFDEVGVGCLAGPVVAAAYAYPLTPEWLGTQPPCTVRDSKKLSEKQKTEAEAWLRGLPGALFAVVEVSVQEIDTINILRASQLAMARCFENVRERLPGGSPRVALLVDGNRLPSAFAKLAAPWFPQTIVKGDDQSFAIAAASILAKVHRDVLMQSLAQQHPHYGWESNVGYPTPAHKLSIQQHGPTDHHRRSFNWGLSQK